MVSFWQLVLAALTLLAAQGAAQAVNFTVLEIIETSSVAIYLEIKSNVTNDTYRVSFIDPAEIKAVEITGPNFKVNDLEPDTSYSFTVAAKINETSYSTESAILVAKTLPPPDLLIYLAVPSTNGVYFEFGLEEATDTTIYSVQLFQQGNTVVDEVANGCRGRKLCEIGMDNLQPNTEYRINLMAEDDGVYATAQKEQVFWTLFGPITGLASSGEETDSQIQIQWTEPEHATAYLLKVRDTFTNEAREMTVYTSPYTISGLAWFSEYEISLEVTAPRAGTPMTEPVKLWTLPNAPDLKVEPVSKTELQIEASAQKQCRLDRTDLSVRFEIDVREMD